MATLIKATGEKTLVYPINGNFFELEELYRLLKCSLVNFIALSDGRTMIVNEEGKLEKDWDVNLEATEAYQEGRMTREEKKIFFDILKKRGISIIDVSYVDPYDCIAGNVLICNPDELE